MINVSEATKSAYLGDSIHKTLTISFPNKNITFTNSDIISESFTLTESIETELYLTFKGCIASQCSFQVAQNVQDLRGQLVTVTIQAGDTDVIPLFKGYVDEQNNETQEDIITEFICYDPLYKIGSKNMQSWVDSRTYPITVKNFRNQLFQNIGITQYTATLVNDSRTISENFKTFCDNPSATDIIKWICEANGVFGQYGRDGKFHYREIKSLTKGTYPSPTTYPSTTTYPSGENADIVIESGANLGLTYEPYEIDLITKVTIYDSGGLDIAYAGSGNNVFGITDNPIAFSLNNMTAAAQAIFAKVGGINYIPVVSMKSVGMPYMECGDTFLSYTKRYIVRTPILSRTLNGIQALFDEYASDSDRNRPEHISTTTTRINKDRQSIIEVQADVLQIDGRVEATEGKFNRLYAGNIQAEQIDCANRIAAKSLAVGKITGSVNSGNQADKGKDWSLDFDEGKLKIGTINASIINAGTISANRIGANSIAVSKLTGSISNGGWNIDLDNGTMSLGSLAVSKITGSISNGGWGINFNNGTMSIGSLAVSKITGSKSLGNNWSIDFDNGSLTIGSISANNITSGTINVDRISANSIDAGKLNVSVSDNEGWGVTMNQYGTSFSKGSYGCGGLTGSFGSNRSGWGIDFSNNSLTVGSVTADMVTADYITSSEFNSKLITSLQTFSSSVACTVLHASSYVQSDGTVYCSSISLGVPGQATTLGGTCQVKDINGVTRTVLRAS